MDKTENSGFKNGGRINRMKPTLTRFNRYYTLVYIRAHDKNYTTPEIQTPFFIDFTVKSDCFAFS